MLKVSFGEIIQGREDLANFIIENKIKDYFKNKFTVVDVGGAHTGWSSNIADCFIDLKHQDTEKLQFNFDICIEKNWDVVLNYVDKNGKFDFSICTHTLEDLYNPYVVLDLLPKISKQGVITTPSVFVELNFVENKSWSGFIHHRYLFGYKNEKIFLAPKLPFLESMIKKVITKPDPEIRFWWEDNVPYDIFMDNYLGPDSYTVIKEYKSFIKDQTDLIYYYQQNGQR